MKWGRSMKSSFLSSASIVLFANPMNKSEWQTRNPAAAPQSTLADQRLSLRHATGSSYAPLTPVCLQIDAEHSSEFLSRRLISGSKILRFPVDMVFDLH